MFGGICRETKECFIVNVANCSAALCQQQILPGKTIISDSWRAFNNFPHQTFNHHLNFCESGKRRSYTNMQTNVAQFRNKIQSGTARDFMELYLAEYMWRLRLNGRDPLIGISEDIAAFMPV